MLELMALFVRWRTASGWLVWRWSCDDVLLLVFYCGVVPNGRLLMASAMVTLVVGEPMRAVLPMTHTYENYVCYALCMTGLLTWTWTAKVRNGVVLWTWHYSSKPISHSVVEPLASLCNLHSFNRFLLRLLLFYGGHSTLVFVVNDKIQVWSACITSIQMCFSIVFNV